MGIYVEVIKTNKENERFVFYDYQFSIPNIETKTLKLVAGKLKIDKKNGEVHTVVLAQGDKGARAQRAAWALIRHWKNGEFPDKTSWES
jgi:uncharacterized protein affecting Mg2+/Co2+ transport